MGPTPHPPPPRWPAAGAEGWALAEPTVGTPGTLSADGPSHGRMQRPRDTALVVKPILVPSRGNSFLPARRGTGCLRRTERPPSTEKVIGTDTGVVGGHEIFQFHPLSQPRDCLHSHHTMRWSSQHAFTYVSPFSRHCR